MKGKIITMGILGMFLLTSITSTVMAASSTTIETPKDKNEQVNSFSMDERCFGYMWTKSGCTSHDEAHIEPNLEFGGSDHTIYIPHGEGVSLWVDWEITEDSWYLYPEGWQFVCNVGSDIYHDIVIEDQFAIDDAQTGKFYYNFSNEYFKAHPDGFSIYVGMNVFYNLAYLNYSDYASYTLVGKLVPLNEPPNTPAKPEGPTKVKYEVPHTYTVEAANDPDGDPLEYVWGIDREDDDYYEVITTTEPEVSIAFPDDGLNWRVYYLKVYVKDDYSACSGWSEPLKIISKRFLLGNTYMPPFWEFSEQFPLLERLLQYLR
jgi:hypothetical protein